MRLENMVKEILEYSSYVSLPGLGSFSVRPIGSQADGAKGDLTAPRMVYSFNTQRQFEDNALIEHLVSYYDASQKTARNLVEDFVIGLKERLAKGEKIAFAGIGTLKLEGEDLVYTADALPYDSLLHTPSYNLKPIRKPKVKNNSSKGLNTKHLVLVFITVVFIFATGLIGYFLYHKYRGKTNVEAVAETASTKAQEADTPNRKIAEDQVETVAVIDSTLNQGNALRVSTGQRQQQMTTKNTVKPKQTDDKQLWYIIVGGFFAKHEGAVYMKEERRRDGYDAHIQFYRNGWRVIIGQYSTYPDALRAKNIFCAKKNDPDAAYVPKEPVLLDNLE